MPDIRAMVQHRQLNLLQDFSHLGTFDVIFCRNVLIYFDQETKIGVFTRLAKRLEDDGFLTLGAAETVVGLTDVFKPHPDKRGLYRPNSACAPSLVPGMPSAKAGRPRVASCAASGMTPRFKGSRAAEIARCCP